jgi:hypothetical protein
VPQVMIEVDINKIQGFANDQWTTKGIAIN